LDDKIELNRRISETLEAIATKRTRETFGGVDATTRLLYCE
jgi:hypothetical protein